MSSAIEGLKKLREPFPKHHISQLPKPTKQQTEEVKADYKKGIRCDICGTWHHPKVVHLSYVGHAALTDRLLDVDPEWKWEPLSYDQNGSPLIDKDGGMWIKLTICGVTRIGYGDAQGKQGGDAMKERIGDALRNAAMRFGCALDLWHKGDLHLDDDDQPKEPKPNENQKAGYHTTIKPDWPLSLKSSKTVDELVANWNKIPKEERKQYEPVKNEMKQKLMAQPTWKQMINDAQSVEELNAIWQSVPESEKEGLQDEYETKLDLMR